MNTKNKRWHSCRIFKLRVVWYTQHKLHIQIFVLLRLCEAHSTPILQTGAAISMTDSKGLYFQMGLLYGIQDANVRWHFFSTEAEYMALVSAIQEYIWLQKLSIVTDYSVLLQQQRASPRKFFWNILILATWQQITSQKL